MAEQSPDYKKLFLEEQRRREEAEQAQKEEQCRREEEQRRREAAEQAQDRAEEKTRKSTLPEFLDACHTHLHSGLTVQTDMTLSTRGDPANAANKLRPENLVQWEDFPAQQAAIWDVLMASDFASERHFTSLHTLEESGEAILRKMMSSELDLHLFQRSTVDDPVTSIIERLYDQRTLRRTFGLKGSVQFENHAAGSIWGYIGDDEFSALVYYVIQHIPFENIVSYNISVCFGQSKVVITLPSLPHLLWIYAPG